MSKSIMRYKDYFSTVNYSQKERAYLGEVVGVDHQILSKGKTRTELFQNFMETVDNDEFANPRQPR